MFLCKFAWMQQAPQSDPVGHLGFSSRVAGLKVFSERLARAMAIARAMIAAGRVLDLTGIDDGVGLLCAQVLDLPIEEGRTMRARLEELRAQSDELAAKIRFYESRGST